MEGSRRDGRIVAHPLDDALTPSAESVAEAVADVAQVYEVEEKVEECLEVLTVRGAAVVEERETLVEDEEDLYAR